MPSKLNEEKDSYTGRRDQDTVPDASHLVVEGRDHTFTKYVGKLDIQPREQRRMSLGHFTTAHPAKGFSITLNPEPDSPEAVVIEITPLGTAKHCELILHIANYSDKTISAEVWQI